MSVAEILTNINVLDDEITDRLVEYVKSDPRLQSTMADLWQRIHHVRLLLDDVRVYGWSLVSEISAG